MDGPGHKVSDTVEVLRQRVVSLFALLIILAGVAFTISYLPDQIKTIRDETKFGADLATAVAANNAVLKMISSTDDSVLSGRLVKATATLPDVKETSGLITGMTLLASSSGIIVRQISFAPGLVSSPGAQLSTLTQEGAGLPKSGVQLINVSLETSTNFAPIASFLDKLNSAQQLIGVNSIKFGKTQEGNGLGASFGLSVYYLPPRVGVGLKSINTLTPDETKLVDALGTVDIFKLP